MFRAPGWQSVMEGMGVRSDRYQQLVDTIPYDVIRRDPRSVCPCPESPGRRTAEPWGFSGATLSGRALEAQRLGLTARSD